MAEKKYIIDNPELMAEWNWEKNNELGFEPSMLTTGIAKKVWWKCIKGHEWQATIANRSNGRGCPYCSGNKVLMGYNDLKTINPKLAEEWNYEKNGETTPETVTSRSGKKVWWKCIKGHEWQTTINSRNSGVGCPYCSSKKVLKGFNDLQTVNLSLTKEWNYEKNIELRPEYFTASSVQKVWWICSKGHEWQARIDSRNNGSGCPICNSERKTSFPEYAIIYYLENYGLKVVHLYKEKGYELDVFIPSKNIAIEYDGYIWHKNKKKKDLEKNAKCEKDGITLYRIREGLLPLNDSSVDYVVQQGQKDLHIVLKKVLGKIIEKDVDVDLERDAIAIENLREFTEKKNSFLFSNPEAAKEWNYDKNKKLKPEYFTPKSNKKVWWKCNKGHEWQTTINNRNEGNGCPYCSGNKVLVGYNDLQTVNPNLAKEWCYERNKGLTPMEVMPNGNKKVWWKCNKGHAWQATINNRNNGRGCPYCAGKKVLKNFNDLKTVNPSLSKEWNYNKNGDLKPEQVSANSGKKVWWKCSKGHEWQATIDNRTKGRGCPYCYGRYVTEGKNDLQTVNPFLANEWNYDKNKGLTPRDILPNSNKKVWWKCINGHEWQAIVASRNKGNGCPQCAKEKRKTSKKL